MTILSSAAPFSSCLQSFPASGMSWLFTSGDQSIGASTSVLPVSVQGSFPFILTSLISLQFRELSKSLLQQHSSEASILWRSTFTIVQFSRPYMNTGKTIALTIWTFVDKMMSVLVNTLSRFIYRGVYIYLSKYICLIYTQTKCTGV